ncbi:MAG: Crp/Fnr family transcriptional regulator, partial [Proteobacteria bacterium]|nr:Crp/Fnr family transcriptional regulator [Pseudomonadota bacterium]
MEQFKPADRLVRAGEHVFAEGETPGHVHTMKSGWVMLYSLLADGRRHIHEFCVRGALLSFGMEPDQPAPYSAQALTDAMICALPRPEISDMLREIPDMAMSLACLAARGQTRAFRQSVDVGHRSARERVAGLLLDLVDRARAAGEATDDPSAELRLPVTQEQIGDALGLTPVHVNRTLRKLRDEDLVWMRAHRLRVVDPAGLAAAA